MNTMLRYAQREVTKLKRKDDTSGNTTVDIVLVFDRSEEDMKKLVGYEAFSKALEALGGEHTEDNIHKACEASGLNRKSVRFDDMQNVEHEDIHLPVSCSKKQARNLLNKNRDHSNSFIYID